MVKKKILYSLLAVGALLCVSVLVYVLLKLNQRKEFTLNSFPPIANYSDILNSEIAEQQVFQGVVESYGRDEDKGIDYVELSYFSKDGAESKIRVVLNFEQCVTCRRALEVDDDFYRTIKGLYVDKATQYGSFVDMKKRENRNLLTVSEVKEQFPIRTLVTVVTYGKFLENAVSKCLEDTFALECALTRLSIGLLPDYDEFWNGEQINNRSNYILPISLVLDGQTL